MNPSSFLACVYSIVSALLAVNSYLFSTKLCAFVKKELLVLIWMVDSWPLNSFIDLVVYFYTTTIFSQILSEHFGLSRYFEFPDEFYN